MVAQAMRMPKPTTQAREVTPVSSSAASAIAARSAPTLNVLAQKSAAAATNSTDRGSLRRNALIRPPPVTIPTRAHMLCTAAMSGQVSGASQSSSNPNRAPAIE
jgi:hypothetical protein